MTWETITLDNDDDDDESGDGDDDDDDGNMRIWSCMCTTVKDSSDNQRACLSMKKLTLSYSQETQ